MCLADFQKRDVLLHADTATFLQPRRDGVGFALRHAAEVHIVVLDTLRYIPETTEMNAFVGIFARRSTVCILDHCNAGVRIFCADLVL